MQKNKLKILFVIPNLLKGGAQKLLIDLTGELKKYKFITTKIAVLSNHTNEFNHLSKGLDIVNCEVEFNLRIFKKNNIRIVSYEKLVDNFKPDIIHSHLYFAELVVHQNPRKHIRYITHFHDNIKQFKNLKSTFVSKLRLTNYFEKIRLFNQYKKVSKTFITVSKDNYNYAKSVLSKYFNNDIFLISNGIKTTDFKPVNKHNLSTIKLINIGNFIKKKNQIFLIDVVDYIQNRGFKVSLDFIGDGEYKTEVYLKAKMLNLDSIINFRGNVNFVNQFLKNSNFYVHSALTEPFGLVLLEAMASKVLVISYNGKGNTDIVINNKTGILINQLDPKLFGEAIIKLHINKSLREKLINNAYEFVKNFDISIYTEKVLKIYLK